MGFAGELTTISLEEVFENIANNRLTGVLTITTGDRQACILFEEGILRALDPGGDRGFDYATIAETAEVIDPEILQRIARRQGRRTLKSLLRGREGFQEERFDKAVAAAVREEVIQILGMREAAFVFEEGFRYDAYFDAEQLGCDLIVDPLLVVSESSRRLEEWERISNAVHSEGDIFLRGSDLTTEFQTLEATRIYDLLDGTRTVQKLVEDLPYSHFHVMRLLTEMAEKGVAQRATCDHLLRLAKDAVQAGELHRAIHHLEVIVEREPGHLPARDMIVDLQHRAGRKQEAARSYHELASIHLERGDLDSGLRAYEAAIELVPHDTDVLEAIVEIHESRAEEKPFVRWGRRLVEEMLRQGMHQEMVGVIPKLLRTAEGDRGFREALAVAHLKLHEREQAVEELVELARETYAAGDLPEALKYYRNVLAIDHASPEAQKRIKEIEAGKARNRRRNRVRRAVAALVTIFVAVSLWQGGREWLAHDALHSASLASLTALGRDPNDLSRSTSIALFANVAQKYPHTVGSAKAEESAWSMLLAELLRVRDTIESDPQAASRYLERLDRIDYPEGITYLWSNARDDLLRDIASATAVTAGD